MHADGWIDVDGSLIDYSNLTRAQDPADRRPDQGLGVDFSSGHYLAFSGYDGVSLTLDARGELYRRYSGLDFVALGGTATYRHKYGLGPNVPWTLASISVARERYREPIRDGDRLVVTLEAGYRASEAFDLALGGTLDRRYGKYDPAPQVPGYSARVFDLQGVSAYLRAGYAINDRLLLTGRVAVRRGDIESTAQRSYAIFVASDAIADDPAFNDPNLYAYRLPATTYSGSLAASWILTDSASLNLVYAGNRTRAAYGLEYADRAVTVSIAYRYP